MTRDATTAPAGANPGILITGDSGFIGRHLIDYLTKHFAQSRIVGVSNAPIGSKQIEHRQCDLSDASAVLQHIQDVRPDHVYHLAGTARVSEGAGLPEYYQSNVTATSHLMKALSTLQKPVRVFLASSVHVYGNRTEVVDEKSPVEPIGHYGFTKYLAERTVEDCVGKNPQIGAVLGRLYSCIGPGQGPGFVTSDLALRLAKMSPDSNEPLNTGPLEANRRFGDVRDVVPVFSQLLSKAELGKSEIFNIASPYEFRIRHLVESLVKVSGRNCRIQSQTASHANPFQGLKVSVEKLNKTLPGLKFRPLDETLLDIWKSVEQRRGWG